MRAFRRVPFAVYWLFVAVCVAVFSIAALAERVEDLPKPTDYVSDYAHVLSPEAIARLDKICAQLDHSKANAQIAVVTIHTLNGDDPADFATRLFTKMKLGKKGSDRGVLVFLAVDDHKRQIRVGYGLEGILPDGKVGDIGRDMVPYLRANDFDGAVTLGVSEVAHVIAADANVTLDEEELQLQMPPPPDLTEDKPWPLGVKIAAIFMSTFILLIVISPFILPLLIRRGYFKRWGWTMSSGSGRRGGSGGGDSGGGDSGGDGDSGGGDSGGGFDGGGGGDTGGGGAGGDW
jgi:uncharacterized protein